VGWGKARQASRVGERIVLIPRSAPQWVWRLPAAVLPAAVLPSGQVEVRGELAFLTEAAQ